MEKVKERIETYEENVAKLDEILKQIMVVSQHNSNDRHAVYEAIRKLNSVKGLENIAHAIITLFSKSETENKQLTNNVIELVSVLSTLKKEQLIILDKIIEAVEEKQKNNVSELIKSIFTTKQGLFGLGIIFGTFALVAMFFKSPEKTTELVKSATQAVVTHKNTQQELQYQNGGE